MRLPTHLDAIVKDAVEFISRLWIIDKQGKRIKLKLTSEQIEVIRSLEAGYSLVIVKARQLGISTVMRAWQFYKAYCSTQPIKCAVITHKMESASEMATKDRTFYDTMPTILRKGLKRENSRGIQFDDSGASIWSYTAGGKGGLRSFSVTDLHISELCFFDDPEELLATALAALNGGQCVVESTAKMFGDPVHALVDRIQRGELLGSWKLLFFPWQEHLAYQKECPDDFVLTTEEAALKEQLGLTNEQIYWRRLKMQEMGLAKFKTEYPSCLEDVFSQKGDAYYTEDDLKLLDIFSLPATEDNEIEAPDPKDRYAIGVDVASGVGKDYSVIFVLSQKKQKPVYIFRSKDISTTSLARKIQFLSMKYNNALALIESNNWGLPVLNELKHLGFSSFWKDASDSDWTTSMKTKLVLHEELKEAIRTGRLNELDYVTVTELKALALNDKGLAPESVRGKTGHSDNVIALGLAWQCLRSLPDPGSNIQKALSSIRKAQLQKHRKNSPFNNLPRY